MFFRSKGWMDEDTLLLSNFYKALDQHRQCSSRKGVSSVFSPWFLFIVKTGFLLIVRNELLHSTPGFQLIVTKEFLHTIPRVPNWKSELSFFIPFPGFLLLVIKGVSSYLSSWIPIDRVEVPSLSLVQDSSRYCLHDKFTFHRCRIMVETCTCCYELTFYVTLTKIQILVG